MNELSPSQQAARDVGERQRNLCLNWLIYIMTVSSEFRLLAAEFGVVERPAKRQKDA